jgi:hypothetical protein
LKRNSSNVYVVLNRNFHLNVNVLGRVLQTVSNVIVQIDIFLYIFETRLETKIFASWTKATLLRIYFRNMSVPRSFLQYKNQCLENVNVKYVIKIFHIVPGINPRLITTCQLRCRAWYRSLGLIPGPIWKMSCNNLLLSHILLQCVRFCMSNNS